MFVGITRAQQQLQISLAQYRDFRGQRKPMIPSSFLMELPRGEMDVQQPETTRVVRIDSEIDDLPDDHEPVFRRHPQASTAAGDRAAEVRPGVAGHRLAGGGRDGCRRRAAGGDRPGCLPAGDGRFAPRVWHRQSRGPGRQRRRADGDDRFRLGGRAEEADAGRKPAAAGEVNPSCREGLILWGHLGGFVWGLVRDVRLGLGRLGLCPGGPRLAE